MLTELRLTNFKAFGETQRIPIKPLTLIFGANSSGKSSIIQSLLLANHAAETDEFDVHHPRLAGDTVDLGGFRSYVHLQQSGQRVALYLESTEERRFAQKRDRSRPAIWEADSFGVTFHIGLRADTDREDGATKRPVVLKFDVWVNAKPILQFERDAKENDGFVVKKVERSHPYWDAILRDCLNDTTKGGLKKFEDDLGQRRYASSKLRLLDFDRVSKRDSDERSATQKCGDELGMFLESRFRRIGDQLLRGFSYLGPLRSVPGRHAFEAREHDPTWTASGAQAWGVLRQDADILEDVNRWLGADHLRTNYQIIVRQLVDKAQPTGDIVSTELLFERNAPRVRLTSRDLGMGVAQVIPVVVGALASRKRMIAIEQPESQLHPALQADLGDVFIESALGRRKNTFLLETHSEHLILRILRRIRETAKGKQPKDLPPIRPSDLAVLFVEPGERGSIVREMEVNERGEFVKAWPGGFFEEGLRETLA